MSLDDELRRALRAEDPGPSFTDAVLASVERERRVVPIQQGLQRDRAANGTASARPGQHLPGGGGWRGSFLVAIAASMTLLAGGLGWMAHEREQARGARARADVLLALKLTNEKLDVVRAALSTHTGHE